MRRMLRLSVALTTLAFLTTTGPAGAADPDRWNDYLDFAYIYSSADSDALRARLDQYGTEAGVSLSDFILERYEVTKVDALDQVALRRQATAYLLQYLANRDVESLEASADAIDAFEGQRGRHENLYWYRYIMAHQAIEQGNSEEFVSHIMELWLEVVTPLESSYDSLEALSLSQSPNSGFVSALPYVYENISRLIVLRSQEEGLNRGLDPIAAIVRLLHDERVGMHPDVIPLEASSKPYLDRIVARLDGAESDAGSLTFTLALFDAGRYHEKARSLLANEGLSDETIKAMGVASGAYATALNRSETAQGEAAVYIRVLRQLGEIYAAKQRLGVDPYVETSFSIEDAITVYRRLYSQRDHEGWVKLGFRTTGHQAYVETLHSLWEEVQEASLNAADYYLTRSLAEPNDAPEHVRSAAQTYQNYLAFFEEFAVRDEVALVPDSAYFAADEAGKGYGDSFLSFSSGNMTDAEISLMARRYADALSTYPFDRQLWSSLAAALERQGRSNEYLARARPIADTVARSRHVHSWIDNEEQGSEAISAVRSALADDLVIMYLGFADGSGMEELEASLLDLREKRQRIKTQLTEYTRRRKVLEGEASPSSAVPAKRADDARNAPPDRRDIQVEKATLTRQIAELSALEVKLARKIAGRARALPLYQATTKSNELIPQLRAQRQHPVHTLLRRMFHEQES
jgi:hypothetical protein